MSIYRRKSGRYAVLVDLEPTAGLRRRKSIGTYRTRKEAERAERQAIEARDRGIDVAPQTVTVADLLQRYIAERESLGRAAKTVRDYRYLDAHVIRPALGDAPAAKLKPARIAEWRDALLRTEKAKQRLGRSDNLSPKTVPPRDGPLARGHAVRRPHGATRTESLRRSNVPDRFAIQCGRA
jgi:hypothetical protein